MSKVSFRARTLDVSKPMPIYMAEELPDLPDYSAINRAVPQMPSGVQKEEECEHHLQRAICAGLIIPTPEVIDLPDKEAYNRIYPGDYKMPRQLIHMQRFYNPNTSLEDDGSSFAMEQDIPDYDMDSEDELWYNSQKSKLDLTPLKFEEMMDRLEKGSGQTVLSVQEAKALLKDDDDLILAVYDYWLNKRLNTQHPLIPAVRTEHRVGSVADNPYVAFRRRIEKMQTRKNRKNDEASYEKMLKLRRDLSRAVTLLELVKRREKSKREILHLTVEVFEKRYQAGDFSGQMLAEVSTVKPTSRPAFAPLFTNQFGVNHQNWPTKDEGLPRKEKRQYKKRKHKAMVDGALGAAGGGPLGGGMGGRSPSAAHAHAAAQAAHAAAVAAHAAHSDLHGTLLGDGFLSSDEDALDGGIAVGAPSGAMMMMGLSEDDDDSGGDSAEGPFAFRRRKHCNYHAPLSQGLGNWPWCSREEGGLADKRFRYCLTTLATPAPGRCVGFARRRVGRGGRVILDRAVTPMDDVFASLDFTILDSAAPKTPSGATSGASAHVRPDSPPPSVRTSAKGVRIADPLLSEMRSSWLHFRPKTPPVSREPPQGSSPLLSAASSSPGALGAGDNPPWLDAASLRLDVETPGGGPPTELSLADVFSSAQEDCVGDPNDAAARLLGLLEECSSRADKSPDRGPEDNDEGTGVGGGATTSDVHVGCSRFLVHPGPRRMPQVFTSASSVSQGTLATGPGRPPGTQQHHRKRHRHHHHHHHHHHHSTLPSSSSSPQLQPPPPPPPSPTTSPNTLTSSASLASQNTKPLSNGVGMVPATMTALLAGGAGLLLQGLSNGPTNGNPVGSHSIGATPGGVRRAISGATQSACLPLSMPAMLIKQEIKQEPPDDPSYPSDFDAYASGVSDGTDGGVGVSVSGDVPGVAAADSAASACAEQQKLKNNTAAQQQQLPMEVT